MALRTYPSDLLATRTVLPVNGSNNFYLASYPKLIAAVAQLTDDDQGNALALVAHAAYGWMPTVLGAGCFGYGFIHQQKPISKLRQCRSASEIMPDLPEASPINNSWIGLSKVLHFINPDVFPIWDSRVAKHFGLAHAYQYNTKKCYDEYALWIEAWSKEHNFEALRRGVRETYGYEMTGIRAAELHLFLSEAEGECAEIT